MEIQCYRHLIKLLPRFVSPVPPPVRWCLSTSLFNRSGRPGAISCIQTRRKSWSESRTTDTGTTRKYRKMNRRESLGSRALQGGKNASVGRGRGRKPLTNQSPKHPVMVRFVRALNSPPIFRSNLTSSVVFSLRVAFEFFFFCLILSILLTFLFKNSTLRLSRVF